MGPGVAPHLHQLQPVRAQPRRREVRLQRLLPRRVARLPAPNRPDVNWQIMQEEKVKLDELKKHPNWGLSGKPGCYSLKWQEKLGAPPRCAISFHSCISFRWCPQVHPTKTLFSLM